MFSDGDLCHSISCPEEENHIAHHQEIDELLFDSLDAKMAIDINQTFISTQKISDLYIALIDSGTMPRGRKIKYSALKIKDT